MPVDALAELRVYGQMVEEIAKHLYREAHRGRLRLPKGFNDRLNLQLSRLDPGSTIPILERVVEPSLIDSPDEFDKANQILVEVVEAASKGQPLPHGFPQSLVWLFEGFGRTLKDDESIELVIGEKTTGPRYNRSVRSNILSSNRKSHRGLVNLIGSVSGFQAAKGTFDFKCEESQQISGLLVPSFDKFLRQAAVNYEVAEARIVGIGKYNPDNSLAAIEQVQHLTIYRSDGVEYHPEISSRIKEISNLEDGWFDGAKGTKYLAAFSGKVEGFLNALVGRDTAPAPFIYPSPSGTIEAEWSLGFWEVSASFSRDGKVSVHALNVESDETREAQLDDNLATVEKADAFIGELLASDVKGNLSNER